MSKKMTILPTVLYLNCGNLNSHHHHHPSIVLPLWNFPRPAAAAVCNVEKVFVMQHSIFFFHFSRTFDRIQENRVVSDEMLRPSRSQSAERRKRHGSKLEAGSSATLTRGFHLPAHSTSKSLWQRVFVGSSSVSSSSHHHQNFNGNGPESLPCSWSVVDMDDKSPTLKHIKQNSFDSGIHTGSDSSEYSIKVWSSACLSLHTKKPNKSISIQAWTCINTHNSANWHFLKFSYIAAN